MKSLPKDCALVLVLALTLFTDAGGAYAATPEALEYQQAAPYTHMQLPPSPSAPVTIRLEELYNLSGIPAGATEDRADYYQHGKLPGDINLLLGDLLQQQQVFSLQPQADYIFRFSLLEYQHPLPFAPDDRWWQKLHDQVDRWGLQALNSRVRMRLTVQPARPDFALAGAWQREVSIALSNCDLNRQPQPLVRWLGQKPALDAYRHSLPGQALIAAVNYLTYQALLHLDHTEYVAKVVGKEHNALLLHSTRQPLIVGEKLKLYATPADAQKLSAVTQLKSTLPLGEVWIAESRLELALAYPVNLRPDQVRIGDRVRIEATPSEQPTQQPRFVYRQTRQCASVAESVAVN